MLIDQTVAHALPAARPLAAASALGALVALLVGGSLMALPIRDLDQAAAWVQGLAVLGPVALAAISVFDMFTVPALHQTLHSHGPALVLVATGCALTGDLIGVVGRLTETAAVVSAVRGFPEPWSQLLQLLQETLNTGGFLLVSVSFSAFGVLWLRAGSRKLGVVALTAGLLTAAGQFPPLQVLFYLANAAYLAWYAALIVTFHDRGDTR